MNPPNIGRLNSNVQVLASTLGELDALGHGDSVAAVVLRMKMAALTTELLAADLIERARRASRISEPSPSARRVQKRAA